jgi:pyrroloquinoline quinone (PQQ) biosynthesis protein C
MIKLYINCLDIEICQLAVPDLFTTKIPLSVCKGIAYFFAMQTIRGYDFLRKG